jgi:hypothetical protein
MNPRSTLLAALLAAAAPAAAAAEPFAPPGARASLTVEYVYESAGKKRSEGMYDPYEWRVKRAARLAADLAAQPATAMPTVAAIDAAQSAALAARAEKAQAFGKQSTPMMADVQKIMARCGEDEACLTREAQKMGAAMQGTPQLETMKKGARELSAQDGARYQAWRPTAQRGSYAIDEVVHISSPDPICARLPNRRCTRDETRKGAGEIPAPPGTKGNAGAAAGFSAVELDAARNTLTVTLPAPLGMLPYTETIVTDEPPGTHDTPTPKGPQAKQLAFRVADMGKPFTVPLKGGWRSQSGEQVVKLKGNGFGDDGTLTVRWRFTAQ